MSREIKFRAWDGEFMLYHLNSITLEDIKVGVIWEGDDITDQKNATYMQYTGLKDKNGVEIYEGDIVVRDGYPWFDDEKPNYRDTVDWAFAGFHTVHHCVNPEKRGISEGINEPIEDGHGWEVIGNIYENPELLGSKAGE